MCHTQIIVVLKLMFHKMATEKESNEWIKGVQSDGDVEPGIKPKVVYLVANVK